MQITAASNRLYTALNRWTPAYDQAPLCPLCGKNRVEIDWEGPGTTQSPMSKCSTCFGMTGYRTHAHVERLTAIQAAANHRDPNHTWHTAEVMYPHYTDGQHVGWVCRDERCTYLERVDEPGTRDALAELMGSDPRQAWKVLVSWAGQAPSYDDYPGAGQLRAAVTLLETAQHERTGTRARLELLEQAATLAATGRNIK